MTGFSLLLTAFQTVGSEFTIENIISLLLLETK